MKNKSNNRPHADREHRARTVSKLVCSRFRHLRSENSERRALPKSADEERQMQDARWCLDRTEDSGWTR